MFYILIQTTEFSSKKLLQTSQNRNVSFLNKMSVKLTQFWKMCRFRWNYIFQWKMFLSAFYEPALGTIFLLNNIAAEKKSCIFLLILILSCSFSWVKFHLVPFEFYLSASDKIQHLGHLMRDKWKLKYRCIMKYKWLFHEEQLVWWFSSFYVSLGKSLQHYFCVCKVQ